jgi:hypothetical protein
MNVIAGQSRLQLMALLNIQGLSIEKCYSLLITNKAIEPNLKNNNIYHNYITIFNSLGKTQLMGWFFNAYYYSNITNKFCFNCLCK